MNLIFEIGRYAWQGLLAFIGSVMVTAGVAVFMWYLRKMMLALLAGQRPTFLAWLVIIGVEVGAFIIALLGFIIERSAWR